MKKLVSIVGLAFYFVLSSYAQNKVAKLEEFAEVPYAVGNIAFKYNGELVFSNAAFLSPEIRVMQYDKKTKKSRPFPNVDWNTVKEHNTNYLSSVLGVRNDTKGIVWMLDMGFRNGITPKFVGWDTKINSLHKIIEVPQPASIPSSYLNDFVIDESRSVFVIADEQTGPNGNGKNAALVIVDISTGQTRRVLEGHYSTIPENIPIRIENKVLNKPKTNDPIMVGADGITLDKANEWLYYGPLNGTKLYRIRMDNLLNIKLSEEQLKFKVEIYSSKKSNGGLSIDQAGNLYLTYIETNSIGVILANNKKHYNFVQDERLLWPNSVSYSDDGYMYAPAAKAHLAPAFNNGIDRTKGRFFIYRFKPIAKGILGR